MVECPDSVSLKGLETKTWNDQASKLKISDRELGLASPENPATSSRRMTLQALKKSLGARLFCFAATALLVQTGCAGEQDSQGDERADKDGENKDSDGKDSSDNEDSSDGEDSGGKDTQGNDADDADNNDGSGTQEPSLMKYTAGSRLKPLVVSASDGAKQFYGWYDNELEVPCTFGMLSHATPPPKDGAKVRCLPAMIRLELDQYYETNGCSGDPIGIGRPIGCDDPSTFKYGKVMPSDICGGEPEIKTIKSVTLLESNDYIWYKDDNGYCKMVDTDISPFAYVEVGEDASLEDFVGGTTEN